MLTLSESVIDNRGAFEAGSLEESSWAGKVLAGKELGPVLAGKAAVGCKPKEPLGNEVGWL